MAFDPYLAEKRFGFGLSPTVAPPRNTGAMLTGVTGPDHMADRFPIQTYDVFQTKAREIYHLRRAYKKAQTEAAKAEARTERDAKLRSLRKDQLGWIHQSLLRQAQTNQGFRERLVYFWSDHFTVMGKSGGLRGAGTPYAETAIRPHIGGRFEDLLLATAIHPLMLHYLDQNRSVGPNSRYAKRRKKQLGLNENLAREILELHTLGVDGPYGQEDVRELAKLLTGLTMKPGEGVAFVVQRAEPGAKHVLGKWYGAQEPRLEDIHTVLRDLARHPATARHIATKLAVHFVSDQPDPDLIAALEASYHETGGELMALYATLLEHPAAWATTGPNIKQPIVFVGSTLRALDLHPDDLANWKRNKFMRHLTLPLRIMGQPWQEPLGPDGWPEEDAQWATPQGMAARLQWALRLPEILNRDLPDPRDLVGIALGPDAPARVHFAAEAAENRREGVALVLMSPAFQRQ